MKAEDLVSETPQWKVRSRNKVNLTPIDICIPFGDLGVLSIYSFCNEWHFTLSSDTCRIIDNQLLLNCKTIEDAIIEAQVAVAKYLASLSAALGSLPLTVSPGPFPVHAVTTAAASGGGNGSTAHGSLTVQSGEVACAASGGGAVCAAFGSPSTASAQMAVIEQLNTMHHLSPKELEARDSFITLRDVILNLNDGLDVNEVLYIIDNFTPEWV